MKKETIIRIGVAGPFNPCIISDFLDVGKEEVPCINIGSTSVSLYVKGLLELGCYVIVFTCGNQKHETIVLNGKNVKVYILPCYSFLKGLGRIHTIPLLNKCIKHEIDNIDVLHAEWTYEYAYVVKKYRKILPIYCSVRDWCPYILSVVKREKSISLKLHWLFNKYFFKKVIKTKEYVFIANSEYTKKQIIEQYPYLKLKLIPNPLFSDKILLKRLSYPKKTTFTSISLSLLNPRKNIDNLLIAFRKYIKINPTAILILVGSYTKEWKNERMYKGLLINVDLVGTISNDKVYDVLDKTTALIHPSLEETFGNILLEAMCRKCLCIGGNKSGAVPEVLGYGKYGLLCNVDSPNSIFEAMKKVSDLELFHKITDDATSYIKSRFLNTTIAKEHINMFLNNINGLKK